MSKVTVWQQLELAGMAGDVCDSIIRSQPLPEKLLRALAKTDAPVAQVSHDDIRVGSSNLKKLPISAAEAEALFDAACGLTAAEASRKRERSIETIRKHRSHVLAKLGAANMAHAVALSRAA